jgi:hypothetical protein
VLVMALVHMEPLATLETASVMAVIAGELAPVMALVHMEPLATLEPASVMVVIAGELGPAMALPTASEIELGK